jgi:hypothetical protein
MCKIQGPASGGGVVRLLLAGGAQEHFSSASLLNVSFGGVPSVVLAISPGILVFLQAFTDCIIG